VQIARSKVHFVGIGGIGMSGLAELLHNMGAQVTGSDQVESSNTQRLVSLGIPVQIGHSKTNIISPNVVVYSSAVNFKNPELQEARAKGIPMIPRAEVLAEVMRLKRGIAIAGTHGKTTTTSMVASILIQNKMDPTVVVGGRLDLIKSNALLGQGEWLVAEADESDGSFLRLTPEIAVITNIDYDHMEHFKTEERLEASFTDFALRVPFYGLAVACGDDPVIQRLFADYPKRMITYGFDLKNDFVIEGSKSHYEVIFKGKRLGHFELNLPGRHNALNAAAAIVAGLEVGLSFEACASGLSSFLGVERRLQWKGERKGIKVFDDYGHHPTEIRAVIQALREKFPDDRLVLAFQPHRYTRTQNCWDQFIASFKGADSILLFDIYTAGEDEIAGINSQRLSEQMPLSNYIGNKNSIDLVLQHLKEGDVFVTLGAGDIWKLGQELLQHLADS